MQQQHRIISRVPQTELQQFAGWFHQDWKIAFSDVETGANLYFKGLDANRKKELHAELLRLLEEEKSSPALLKAWYALGAQGWQANLDIRETLKKLTDQL